jgi:hypothetical protein
MKKSLVIIALFFCISGWYSCTKDKAQVQVTGACDSTLVTYNNSIARIVSTYCTNNGACHNPQSGLGSGFGLNALDLTTIAAVRNGDQDTTSSTSIVCWLKSGCSGVETMPKNGRQLSRAYIDTFLMWKANNFCQGN